MKSVFVFVSFLFQYLLFLVKHIFIYFFCVFVTFWFCHRNYKQSQCAADFFCHIWVKKKTWSINRFSITLWKNKYSKCRRNSVNWTTWSVFTAFHFIEVIDFFYCLGVSVDFRMDKEVKRNIRWVSFFGMNDKFIFEVRRPYCAL